jgi:hypothetical protein
MKETLSSKYGPSIEQYLHDQVMFEVSYKSLQSIHTEAVSNAKSKQRSNPLIQHRPLAVTASETSLLRPFQTTLSQLLSTYCSSLKTYQLKICAINNDICSSCMIDSQSVLHLFSCPAYPCSLSPIDLWYNPVTVVKFLVTLPAFCHLPPLDASFPLHPLNHLL